MLDVDPSRAPAEPRDAATVVLVRDEPGGGLSVFLVKRHGKSGFMAGAHVFPGGVLEPGDRGPILARLSGRTPERAAALLNEEDAERAIALHVAALRETFEEAGLLVARDAARLDLAQARRRLLASEITFEALIHELQAELQADALVPLARWVTPIVEKRRSDARFFLARAPEGQIAEHDRVEVTAGEWLTPEDALAAWDSGTIQLAPPTLRTLEELAAFATVEQALAHAASRPPPLVQPVFRDLGGTWALTLPGDPEHPERERVLPGPTRFVLIDGRFQSREP
ncbi:MAG: NUDIX hydrolase [Sandaracinaceae bacterium]|nr:NUDIX hydrolase [Sandaracinaceae bacterium]